MTSLRLGTSALDFLNPNGLARPAIEKFAGAWLACFVVMAHGDFGRLPFFGQLSDKQWA